MDTMPNNLPVQLTSFIGREQEIAEVKRLLASTRLLTLTGAGGSGKTRLTLQVATGLLAAFPDGVWFVALAPLSDPALVVPTIAQTLGVREMTGRALLDMLKDHLREKQLLIVLDNFEQVMAAAATTTELLTNAPQLKLLVTSRELLRVTGERNYPVAPLTVPDPGKLPSREQLTHYTAVQLFIERAQAVKPDFALSDANAPAVAEVCYQLDGLPLALELAAARVRLLTPQKLLTQLNQRLRFLTGGARDAPARQQTLRATVDWSYDLLTPAEQTLFRRLGVFVGGWTLEATEAVGADGGQDQILPAAVLDLLGHLVDKSLVVFDELATEPRYTMLETIRQYAREKLLESGETERVQRRHLRFFLQLAESAEPHLIGGQVIWLNRLEMEHDNLRAALAWSGTAEGDAAGGLRLAGALFLFWDRHGHFQEGRQQLLAALAGPGVSDQAARAKALNGATHLAYMQSDYVAARSLGEASVSAYRALGRDGRQGLALVLGLLGYMQSEVGDYATAMTRMQESLGIVRELNDPLGIGVALRDLGTCLLRMGDFDAAAQCLQEALSLSPQIENPYGSAIVLTGLAEIALRRGDYERAAALEQQSLKLRQELGDKWGMAVSLGNFAWILLRQGDPQASALRLAESLRLRRELGDKGGIAWCLEKFADIALTQAPLAASLQAYANFRSAARLLGAAATIRASVGSTRDLVDQLEYERQLGLLRAHLDAPPDHSAVHGFEKAWAEGEALTMEQAIEYALKTLLAENLGAAQPLGSPKSATQEFGGLTMRQREVAVWVARGATNREIAQELTVGERTIESHIGNILNKLGFSTRAQIRKWAFEIGLVKITS